MRVAQVAQHAMFSAARGRGSRGLWRRALRSGTAGGAQPRVRVVREHVHDGNSGATGARDRGRARGGRPGAVPGRCASSARRPGLRGVGGGPGSLRAGCAGPTGWEACRGASAVGGLRRAAAVAAFVWGMWVFLKLAEIDPCACGPVPVQYFGTERSGGFLIACRRETWSLGSAGEHRLHTAGVTGSNPVATTMKQQVRSLLLLTFFFASGIFAQARRRPLAPARLRAGLHLRGPPSHPRSRQHAFAPLPSVRNVTHRLR